MRAHLTRERLVEVIRSAYHPNNDLDADGPGCGCCWGNTCPEHAAAAVLAAVNDKRLNNGGMTWQLEIPTSL